MAMEKDIDAQIAALERKVKDLKHEMFINQEVLEQTNYYLVQPGWDDGDMREMKEVAENLERENEIYKREQHKLNREIEELKKRKNGGNAVADEPKNLNKIKEHLGLFSMEIIR